MRTSNNSFTVIVLLGSAVYLYFNLFTFTGIPLFLGGDQVYFWTYGLRILHGERMYQDFFTMHPPGTGLFYSALFALLGPRIWVTNLAVLVLGVALSWVCFRIASQIMENSFALLAAWLFLVLVYGKLLNGTHHWFSVLAVMGAIATIIPSRTPWRIVFAGALLGVASFFTQTRGLFALLGLAAFLVWQWHRERETLQDLLKRQTLLFLSFVTTLVILSSYFIATTGLRTLLYFQITYVREHLVKTAFLGLPELPTWRWLPFLGQYLSVYALLPVVYALSLYRCWRGHHGATIRNWGTVTLVCLVGLCLLAEVAFSVNWLRVFVVSMPGIILLIWIVAETRRVQRCALTLVWSAVVCLALAQTWSKQVRRAVVAELPAGRVSLAPQAFEKLDWVAQRTRPEEFFFQAAWTSFYLPLKLRNPVFLDLLESSALTSPRYVELSIQQLEARGVQYILWPPRLNSPDSFYGPEQYHLGQFRDYLHSRYHRVWSFSDRDEIWERN